MIVVTMDDKTQEVIVSLLRVRIAQIMSGKFGIFDSDEKELVELLNIVVCLNEDVKRVHIQTP